MIIRRNPPATTDQQDVGRAEINPPPRRRRLADAPASPLQSEPEKTPLPRRRRGHATKDANGKWQPAGDYQHGFAKPPREHQFDGSKPGPGRPKGSGSQADVIRDELSAVHEITVNGVRKKVQSRQLAVKMLVKRALEKQQFKDLMALIELARQHFPELPAAEAKDPVFGMSQNDRELLAQLFAGLDLGEAIPEAGSPLSDAMLPADPAGPPDETWEDEDWDQPAISQEEGDSDV